MAQQNSTSSFQAKLRQCLSDIVYAVFSFLLFCLFRIFFRVRVEGLENCPKSGPLLIVCNHISEWDPPFFGSCLPWQVNWLAKVELFELLGGKMNGFFEVLHCVPVDREKTDFSAIKQVVKLLRGNRPVVIFAEGGTRTDETSILGTNPQLKEGAASMAILAGCPILPAVLNGTVSVYHLKNWLFRRQTLEVVIGPVFNLTSRDRSEASKEILEHLLDLRSKLKNACIS
jgi:1-acyl-sn-glycerol-3-phosphate acyltransferase